MLRPGRTVVAGLALAGWSVLLLDATYLEPLPSSAGWLGVVLLLMAALGAGLVSGWRWRTLLLLMTIALGLIHLSPALLYGSALITRR